MTCEHDYEMHPLADSFGRCRKCGENRYEHKQKPRKSKADENSDAFIMFMLLVWFVLLAGSGIPLLLGW